MRTRHLLVFCALAPAWLPAGPAIASEVPVEAASEPVRAMAERFSPTSVPVDAMEQAVRPYCGTSEDAADLAEALLMAGHDVVAVVRDVILACGAGGNAPEVAAAVASRARYVKGDSSGYLIDAGVLAAASEIARRQREPVVAVAATADVPADRDVQRERFRRMMEKGLLDDEYREYIEEQRRRAEEVTPAAVVSPYTDWDSAVYANLYNIGLVTGGFYDPIIDVGADPGGTASLR